MKHFKTEDLYDNERFVNCKHCGAAIVHIESHTKACDVNFVCKCGQRGDAVRPNRRHYLHASLNANKDNLSLYKTTKGHVCPKCAKVLFKIFDENVRVVSFDAVCNCNRRYTKAKETNDPERCPPVSHAVYVDK